MIALALISYSDDPAISAPVLARIANALEVQLLEHYASLWQASGLPVVVYDRNDTVPDDVAPLFIFDTGAQAGELADHGLGSAGGPFGRAFWAANQARGGTLLTGAMALSVSLSHEAVELVADPYVNTWADEDASTQLAFEIADPVQADCYEIDGVAVSNFVGPRWFRHGPGPYDHMRLVEEPWTRRPGGYVIQRKLEQTSESNVFSRTVLAPGLDMLPDWQRDHKRLPSSRTSRRGAVAP